MSVFVDNFIKGMQAGTALKEERRRSKEADAMEDIMDTLATIYELEPGELQNYMQNMNSADFSKKDWLRAAHTGYMSSDRQAMAQDVFDAFVHAGFSEAQARALTAEINRENSMDPQYLFGGHSDPHNRAMNVGMLSWQGDRAPRLMQHLRARGVVDENGNIMRTRDALNAQAEYLRWEMENDPSYAETRRTFLANPEIDMDSAHRVLGRNFIRWRHDDPQYRDSGYQRIREGYALLGSNPSAGFGATSGVRPPPRSQPNRATATGTYDYATPGSALPVDEPPARTPSRPTRPGALAF